MRHLLPIFLWIILHAVASAATTSGTARRWLARCSLSAAIGVTVVQSLPSVATAAETSSNKRYVLGAKQALDAVAASLTSDNVNVKDVYADLEFIMRNYRLKDRLPLMIMEATTMDNRNCVEENGKLTVDQLMTISEYFSVSNDGRAKMMISDAYPNQKLNFIRQGLSAVRSTMNKTLFCAN